MHTASNLAYEELAKAELVMTNTKSNEYIQKALVLALLAIAEELARANENEERHGL